MLRGGVTPRQFTQPDELKNLYNDPDKNIKDPSFNLNLDVSRQRTIINSTWPSPAKRRSKIPDPMPSSERGLEPDIITAIGQTALDGLEILAA